MFKNTVLTLILFLSLFLVLGTLSADEIPASDAQSITLGYVDFPPYEYEDSGTPSGVLVDIVDMIFQKADIPVELQYLPFKRAYQSTKDGVIDGIFNFYKTEERQEHFDYSEPIIKNPLVIFVRKDSNIEFNKLEDLKGLNVGTMHGYSYGTDFDENTSFFKDKAISHISNFKKLTLGRIDAYPCDKLVGLHVAIENNFMSELKMLPIPIKLMEGHIGFTKGKHQDTIDRLNKVILEMHQSGEIKKMIDQYIDKNL